MSQPSGDVEMTAETREETTNTSVVSAVVPRTLSARQERRLMDALEARFLDLTRNYKKRTTPDSTTPTLAAYLATAAPLLALTLLTPPASSAALRTAFLLRHTSDVLGIVPGYAPTPDALPSLLAWADTVDRGWLAVLHGQRWNSARTEGEESDEDAAHNGKEKRNRTGVSETDRIRLKSLLLTGTSRIEEWLARMPASNASVTMPATVTAAATGEADAGQGVGDVDASLDALGLRERFEDLFVYTLAALGVEHDMEQVQMTNLVEPELLLRFGDEDAMDGATFDDEVSSDGERSEMEEVRG